MTHTMRAIQKTQPASGLDLVNVPRPTIGPTEVLIQVEMTAICGTDVHIYQWNEWAQRAIKPGLIVGHEFVGTIAKVGEGVVGHRVGDRVTAEGHVACGICRNCRAGRNHLCPNTVGIGVERNGAFAEYVAVPAANLWPLPSSIPSEHGAFFDPFGNATHCALSFDLVGEDVLITGAGPIGVMAAGIARHVGARHIVVTDINDYRLNLAKELGATRVVNVQRESLDDVIGDLEIEGFDVGLEMSGVPSAFDSMLSSMYHGGKIALLGLLPKGTGVSWDQVIFKGLEIKGIYGRRMYETWYKMTQMALTGFPLDKVLTHRIDIKDYEQGFDLMQRGECGKVVCEW